jgi:transposase-like protein
MKRSVSPELQDEGRARAYLEKLRWPHGPVCPHCGNQGAWRIDGGRAGLYKCAAYVCGEQFTVTVRSALAGSKVRLRTWLMAVQRICEGDMQLSARALARELGVTYKTAGIMHRRIREALERERDPVGTHRRTSHERIDL